jgi:hypothetical protein
MIRVGADKAIGVGIETGHARRFSIDHSETEAVAGNWIGSSRKPARHQANREQDAEASRRFHRPSIVAGSLQAQKESRVIFQDNARLL